MKFKLIFIMAIAILSVESHAQNQNSISEIFNTYFSLKNSLVNSDSELSSTFSNQLISQLNSLKMSELDSQTQEVWMKVKDELISNSQKISTYSNLEKQRMAFAELSNQIYELAKNINFGFPVYLQHCPMANNGKGADWLSKSEKIENPYFGEMMLSCGKTIEILK